MSELTNIAPGQESNNVQEPPKQETIGEAIKPKSEETVPLSALLEMKKANKALAREMAELKKSMENGASNSEVAESVDSIISEYSDVDPSFIKKLVSATAAEANKKAEEKIAEKLKPIQEREEASRLEAIFAENFEKAMQENPEYKGIVNRDILKRLSLLPDSANKTFSQLIEETYGNALVGKRSLDSASSRAGKDSDTKVDMSRMKTDSAYVKSVLADPDLKKQYNDAMIQGLISRM